MEPAQHSLRRDEARQTKTDGPYASSVSKVHVSAAFKEIFPPPSQERSVQGSSGALFNNLMRDIPPLRPFTAFAFKHGPKPLFYLKKQNVRFCK